MHNDLINLLPQDRRRKLARDYRIRLGAFALILTTILTGVAAILLIPTYVYLGGSAAAKKTHLASIESTFTSADEAALSARLALLSKNAATLVELSNRPSISSSIRQVLAIPRQGVTLSGLLYTPAADKTPSTLVISGTSATRDALRSYQLALQAAPFARSAALPVSAYASDIDIAFTITLTLAL